MPEPIDRALKSRSAGRPMPTVRPWRASEYGFMTGWALSNFSEVDRNGRMYVFAENIPASGGKAGAFVARYSPTGALEGIYELPLINVPLSRRFVAVSVNGDVYFLRTQSGGVEILGVGFRPVQGNKVIDIRTAAAPPPAAVPAHEPITAVRPLTRQRSLKPLSRSNKFNGW